MRVAIADDSPHFREGLRALLTSLGVDVAAVVERGADLVSVVMAAPATAPVDVALVDMRMPPTGTDEGLRTARRIKACRPDAAVLVFSADDEAPYAAELLGGALPGTGYALKPNITQRDVLRSTLSRLVRGEIVVDGDVARRLVTRPERAPDLLRLDERERAALVLALRGQPVEAGVLAGLRLKLGLPAVPGVTRQLLGWLLAPADGPGPGPTDRAGPRLGVPPRDPPQRDGAG